MGTPLLWWSAIIAVAMTIGFYINTSNHNESGGTQDYAQVGTSNLMAFETAV
jgi:hypothetical protein